MKHVARALIAIAFLAGAPLALAQGKSSAFASNEGSDPYHGFNISMPIVNLNKEAIIHVEFNLGGHATMAVEGVMKGAYEEVDEEETKETGETRSSTARGASLFFARYSQPNSMGGFYWGLGMGYRQEDVDWKVRPDKKGPAADYTLLDREMRLTHDARLTGTTGHMRVGYRYVGEEFPFTGGGYLGLRHFQAGVEDGEPDENDNEEKLAAMTDREKASLRRKYATRPEVGLEVGFRF